ncbi:MAG: hypothetical protein LAE24_12415 [Candidatus Contendobacter sp.]|nr:hypothetical protein [Candidatus Contendobacter sp.]
MQTVKASYRNGNIQLLTPLTGVEQAELLIVVLDHEGETKGAVAASFQSLPSHSEQDFKALGLASFFDTNDDNQVDWEDVFDVKPR